MSKDHRFDNRQFRVRLRVYDPAEFDNKYTRGEPVMFLVQALPQYYHTSTAFTRGRQLYYGDCLAAAWGAVYSHNPDAVMPFAVKKYLEPVGNPLVEVLD